MEKNIVKINDPKVIDKKHMLNLKIASAVVTLCYLIPMIVNLLK